MDPQLAPFPAIIEPEVTFSPLPKDPITTQHNISPIFFPTSLQSSSSSGKGIAGASAENFYPMTTLLLLSSCAGYRTSAQIPSVASRDTLNYNSVYIHCLLETLRKQFIFMSCQILIPEIFVSTVRLLPVITLENNWRMCYG